MSYIELSPSVAGGTAATTTFTPAGNVAATDVQAAIVELDTEKAPVSHTHAYSSLSGIPATFAPSTHSHPQSDVTSLVADLALKAPLASPVFTGDARAVTPTAGDNDTSIATTAFVTSAVATVPPAPPPATVAPIVDGVAAVGTTTKYAREDHIHPTDTSRAALTQVVRYDAAQSLTAAQMSQARANIDVTKKNYIINGAMMVSQENGNASGSTVGYYPVDGFAFISGGTTGVVSGQQIISATPAGSPNRARWAVVTSDAALAAGDVAFIRATVEGLRAADLRSGTAGAKTVTLRFGINALAGTYCVAIRNAAGNKSYVVPVTVPAGESIQSVTIPLDTAGTWASDNTLALEISWCLMSGTTYQTASPNTWTATGAIATSAQTNWLANAPATIFELFDVSLTEGTVAPPFVVPDYDSELAACQRYWRRMGGNVASDIYVDGYNTGGSWITNAFHYPQMRSNPTAVTVGAWATSNVGGVLYYPSRDVVTVGSAISTTGRGYFSSTTSMYIALNARL